MVLNQVEQRVCNRINDLEEELLEVLSGLISIDTADPPGEGFDE